MSNDCFTCPVEKECGYEYKPCDCVHQRKFKHKSNVIASDKNNNGITDGPECVRKRLPRSYK